ncbi:putative pre-rRNA processing protein Mrd1 [Pseudovirgaria hyperparasitica]|uniref:Multiple RNA-binding domain-containing protein 1 n=1 Tax=Pseudovirgaria hyperparasitica TaxID=470096 RepID=A0A6A6W9T8_9PEZI|nr:putative pre-rRNA processing protein Mrd1 [Pseudovirgaria hyperparasitica]KAF2758794.1 putative pre-rRNA processing protein Mrd1 [Pseudovirgaria hyperparasitica]
MASSRIFVRGLPPTLTDEEFKKHFSSLSATTDTKLFQQRRIGYVGYRTPEEAAKAVKYFNRTFIRMSKIHVESARPISESNPRARVQNPAHASTDSDIRKHSHDDVNANPLKRKRGEVKGSTEDPKLQEFLEVMQRPSKPKNILGGSSNVDDVPEAAPKIAGEEAESDDEYQEVRKKSKGNDISPANHQHSLDKGRTASNNEPPIEQISPPEDVDMTRVESVAPPATDADWLRSRTSRLLDIESDEDDAPTESRPVVSHSDSAEEDSRTSRVAQDTTQNDDESRETAEEAAQAEEEVAEPPQHAGGRLFIRNLPYDSTEDSLQKHFEPYGRIDEVHVPVSKKTGSSKGFAYIQYVDAESASKALEELDGTTFAGRLLHILPAAAKKETKLDEFALSKLPLKKQQQIRRKADASTSTFNWNSLYMNTDAVLSSVADRLGLDKSEVLDPTSSDAAIKQAHAETHVINETKSYFAENGVDLEAFRKRERGDTAILVKNFPYDTKRDELKDLFEQYGTVTRLLIPPTGTIAVVQYAQPTEARTAFGSLAYRKFRDSVLFLEKAPKDLFTTATGPTKAITSRDAISSAKDPKLSAADLLQKDQNVEVVDTSTLFVRNLSFATSGQKLTQVFKPLDGFVSATVKTKVNPKNPSEKLSMGFGFLEFRSKEQAQAAASAMNGYELDGHRLLLRASHKGLDAAEERRREDKAKRAASKSTKIIIKNLPFETNKKDVRTLFGAYGQLRSVRVPKKFDNSTRGFAFAEFTTPREAENALEALRNTHILGRKLVLEFATQAAEDAEEELERMQKKVGSQVNKVALQNLTGAGRKKFNVAGDDGEE